MNPEHRPQLHLVRAKVNETHPDLGTLLRRSRTLVEQKLLELLLCRHLQQRLHRKKTQRTTQIDLALDDHLAQHMTLVHRLMKDLRGPSGISERLWLDCDQHLGL